MKTDEELVNIMNKVWVNALKDIDKYDSMDGIWREMLNKIKDNL